MNYRRGAFRGWVLASGLWVVVSLPLGGLFVKEALGQNAQYRICQDLPAFELSAGLSFRGFPEGFRPSYFDEGALGRQLRLAHDNGDSESATAWANELLRYRASRDAIPACQYSRATSVVERALLAGALVAGVPLVFLCLGWCLFWVARGFQDGILKR